MKNVNRIFSVSFVLLAMLVFGQATTKAQSSDVQTYQGELSDGNRVEIIHSPNSKKLGVIIKDQDGSWTAGYIVQDVENIKGTFYLNNAKKFGKTDDSLFVTLKLSKFRGSSVMVKINNGQAREFQKDYSTSFENMKAPFGYCNGVCVPANPENYSWNFCFLCCFNNSGAC